MRRYPLLRSVIGAIAGIALAAAPLAAQGMQPTTPRGADEGQGPFPRMVLWGVTVVDGTGAPPRGPMAITIENDRITSIQSVGVPGRPTPEPRAPAGTEIIDLRGHWVLPGFVDMHAHTGGAPKAPQAEYVYKLWLGHGITTSRGVAHGGFEWQLEEAAKSDRNEIVAPRMISYTRPGTGSGWTGGTVDDPETARAWVRWAAAQEVEGQKIDGLKLGAYDPDVMAALIDEAHEFGLGTVAHLDQLGVARMTALDAARLGLDMMTHYYGLFESMLTGTSVQAWPLDYNYNNEQDRFGNVARLWFQSAEPGSEQWNALIDEFLELDFGLDPTMTIYEASRDVMRAREADFHDEYTLPSMHDFYAPSRDAHGSYWFYWTSEDEYHWKRFYNKWMEFVNDYKNAGGIVTTGSDSGFIYKLYGFDYIRELELLREAGFHPIEVIRAATYHGALQLAKPSGAEIEFGLVRPGMKADLVVVDQNPLENLKVLYGNGTPKLNDETGESEQVGGIKYTVKDGIVYDARKLLEDVKRMVAEQKRARATTDGAGR